MEQEQEMKGGHLPAERVGGRRVINKKERRASENERASSESSGEDSLAQIERDTTLITQVKEVTTAITLSELVAIFSPSNGFRVFPNQ